MWTHNNSYGESHHRQLVECLPTAMLYTRSVQGIGHKDLCITFCIMFLEVTCRMNALYVGHESSNSSLLGPDLLNSVVPLFVMMSYV